MDVANREKLENELSKLTILQLRNLARQNSIDVTSSIRKKEIIDKLIEAGVSGVEDIASQEEKAEEKTSEKKNHHLHPNKKMTEIREYIGFVMSDKPSFFVIDSKLEAALAMYSSGNYDGAIRAIKDARKMAAEVYSHFRVYTNALGIDTSEKLLHEAASRGTITESNMNKLVENAMSGFVDGSPAKREETLEKLENEAMASFDKIIGGISGDLELKQKRLSELREIGANVFEVSEILAEAERLKQALRIDDAKREIKKAEDLMSRAEKSRTEEIRYLIPRVRASVEEAKSIGINVISHEKDLEKASYHYEKGDLKNCVEALGRIDGEVDQSLHQRFSVDPTLRGAQIEKARGTVQRLGAFFSEATTYGIDVSEALHYTGNAQMAINRNDAINAPKFARRAEELSKHFIEELNMLREKAVHVTGTKCWQCGQEMLYDYQNGMRRCSSCGSSRKK